MTIDLIDRPMAAPVAVADDFLSRIERRRAPLAEAMARHLVARGSARPGQARHVAGALLEILIDDARPRRGGAAGPDQTGEIRRHLRRLGVRAEQFSSFGDGLAPVLRDAFGVAATPERIAAWGDAYWRIVRSLD